ncbi:Acyl-CoA dehydrogenase [Parageobacillus caldoxylosilyticus]|nr:Acyl-CoA dehydrogenase [Parageobacillus caldoxylosilyticus]
MDFTLPKEIEFLKENVRKFVKEVVDPVAMEIEENDQIPEHIIEKSKEMGLFGLSIPEEYGGLGLSMVGKCAIYEELGKTHNGYTTLIGAHTGIGTVGIVELGTEEQKRRYLPKMATGEWIGAFAYRAWRGFQCGRIENDSGEKRRPLHYQWLETLYYKCGRSSCLYRNGGYRSFQRGEGDHFLYRRKRLSGLYFRKSGTENGTKRLAFGGNFL